MMGNDSARESTQVEVSSQEAQLSSGALAASGNASFDEIMKILFEGNQVDVETMMKVISNLPGSMDIRTLKEKVTYILENDSIGDAIDLIVDLRKKGGLNSYVLRIISLQFANHFRNVEGEDELSQKIKAPILRNIREKVGKGKEVMAHIGGETIHNGLSVNRIYMFHDMYEEFIDQFFIDAKDFDDTDACKMFAHMFLGYEYVDISTDSEEAMLIDPGSLEETTSKNKAAFKKYLNSAVSNAMKTYNRYMPIIKEVYNMHERGERNEDVFALLIGAMLEDNRGLYSITKFDQDIGQIIASNEKSDELKNTIQEVIDSLDPPKKDFLNEHYGSFADSELNDVRNFNNFFYSLLGLFWENKDFPYKSFINMYGYTYDMFLKTPKIQMPDDKVGEADIERYKKIGYSYLLDKFLLEKQDLKLEDIEQISPILIGLGNEQLYLNFCEVFESKEIFHTVNFIRNLKNGFDFVDQKVKKFYIQASLNSIFLNTDSSSTIDFENIEKQIKFCLEYKDIDLAIEIIIKLRRQSNDGNEMASILEEYCSDKFYNCFGDKSKFTWYMLRGVICKHLFRNPYYDKNYYINDEKVFKEDLVILNYANLNIYPSEVEGFVREFFIEKRSIEDTNVAKRFLNLSVKGADSSERNMSGLKSTARVLFNELKYIIENYLLIIKDGSLDDILGTLRNEFDDPNFVIKWHTIASFFCADAYSDVINVLDDADFEDDDDADFEDDDNVIGRFDSARQNEIFSDFTTDEKALIFNENFQEMVKKTDLFLNSMIMHYRGYFLLSREYIFITSSLDDHTIEKSQDELKNCIDDCYGNAAFTKVFDLKPFDPSESAEAADRAKETTENFIHPDDFNEMESEEFLSYVKFYLPEAAVTLLKKILENYDFTSIINLNKYSFGELGCITHKIRDYIVAYLPKKVAEKGNVFEKSIKKYADYLMSIGDDELSQKVRGFAYYINEKSINNLTRFCTGDIKNLENFDALSHWIEPLLEKLRSGESPNLKDYKGILIHLSSEKIYSDFCDVYEGKDLYHSLILIHRLNSDEKVDERARCIYSLYLQNLFSETPNAYIMKGATKTELSNLEVDYKQIKTDLEKILGNDEIFKKFKKSIDNEDFILAIKVIKELREKSTQVDTEDTEDRQSKYGQALTLLSQEYHKHFKATYKDIVYKLNIYIRTYFGRKYYDFFNDNGKVGYVGDEIFSFFINHKRSILSPEIVGRFIDEFFLKGKDIESTAAGSIFSALFAGLEYHSDYEKNAALDEISKLKSHSEADSSSTTTTTTTTTDEIEEIDWTQVEQMSDTEKIDFLKHFYPERYANPKNLEKTKNYNLYGNAMYARSLLNMAEDFLEKYAGIFYASISMNMDICMLIGFFSTEPDLDFMNNYQQDLANFCDIVRYNKAGISDEEVKSRRDTLTALFTPKEKEVFFDPNVIDLTHDMSCAVGAIKQLFYSYVSNSSIDFANMMMQPVKAPLEACLKMPNFKEVIKFQEFDPKSPEAKVARTLGKKILDNQGEAKKLFDKAKKGENISLDEIIEKVGFLLNTVQLKLFKNAIENNNIENAISFLQTFYDDSKTEKVEFFQHVLKNHFKKISHTEGVMDSLRSFFMKDITSGRKMHIGIFDVSSVAGGNFLLLRTTFTFDMIDEFIEEFFTNGSLEKTKLYNLMNGLSLGEEYFNSQGAMSSEEIERVDEDKVKNPVKYKSTKPKTYEETKAANLEAVINYIKYLINAAKSFLREYIDLFVNKPNFEVILGILLESKGILDIEVSYNFQQDLSFFYDKLNSSNFPDEFKNKILNGIEKNDRELFFGESRKTIDDLILNLMGIFTPLWNVFVQRFDTIAELKDADRKNVIDMNTTTVSKGIRNIQGLDLGTIINSLGKRKIYSNSERAKYERAGKQFLEDKGVLEIVDSQLGIPEAEAAIYSDLSETSGFVKKYGHKSDEACLTFILRRMGYKWITSDNGESLRNSFCKELTVKWANTDQFDNVTDVKEKIQEKMDSLGNGARAIISVKLGLLSSTYFFVAEQIHGEALFLDPQTGEKVSDKYLGKARRLQIGKLTVNGEPATLSPAVSPVHKESDVMSDINEALRGVNKNSKNTSDYARKDNCQRCCVAYELRRRGEKVVAKPFIYGDETKELTLLINIFDQVSEKMDLEGNGAVLIQNIKRQMEKWGNGSRAMISFTLADRVSGHCFIAEQVNGKTIFLEPQREEQIEDLNKSLFEPGRIISQAYLARMDNALFKEAVIDDCCEVLSPATEASSAASSPVEGSPRLESPGHEEPETSSAAVSPAAEASSPASSPVEGSPRLESPGHEESATSILVQEEQTKISDNLERVKNFIGDPKNKKYNAYAIYELQRNGYNVVAKNPRRDAYHEDACNRFQWMSIGQFTNIIDLKQKIEDKFPKRLSGNNRVVIKFDDKFIVVERFYDEILFLDLEEGKELSSDDLTKRLKAKNIQIGKYFKFEGSSLR